ncbi:MAG: protein tyrosine phosphatase family protein, partial [Herminiimonas sp.]|nr:protein tyrosine phosphatase family protein [Herminiimonas sp.]
LSARGFQAVIYLAPLAVGDSVADEPQILARQGITFVHIPIAFNQPTGADFDRFAAAMNDLANKKVLVHCQINLRASSMTFLYRTIVGKEDPQVAFAPVEKVWVPTGVWQKFIETQLKANGIMFDPF